MKIKEEAENTAFRRSVTIPRGVPSPSSHRHVVSEKTRIPVTAVNTHAEDLWALGMFDRQDSTVGDAITYSMAGGQK